jgi:hypothetical protein
MERVEKLRMKLKLHYIQVTELPGQGPSLRK